MVVLEISKIGYRVRSEQFKITAISSHNNEDDDSYGTSTGHYESDYNNDQDGKSYSGHYESDYNNDQDGKAWSGDYESDYDTNYQGGSNYPDYNETNYGTSEQDNTTSSGPTEWDHSDYSSSSDETSHDTYNGKSPLSMVTPTSATVWQADSYQSVTWKFDGSCKFFFFF